MATTQCPFDGVTLSDDTKNQGEIDAELDKHLREQHGTTLFQVRQAENALPRTDPYYSY